MNYAGYRMVVTVDPGGHRLPSFGHSAGFAKVGGFSRGLIFGVFWQFATFQPPPPLFFKPPKLPTPWKSGNGQLLLPR